MTTETLPTSIPETASRPDIIDGQRAVYYARELAALAVSSAPEANTFIDPIYLRDHSKGPGVELKCGDEVIDWPVDSIVAAESFISWEEGRGHDVLKDRKLSRDVMLDYAGRDTEIPPIDFGLTVYLTPSGKMVAMSENAHRVGASKIKGQKTIGINTRISGIVVKSLPDEDLERALRWSRGEW